MARKDGRAYANELAYYVFQGNARYAEACRDEFTFWLQQVGDGFTYGIDIGDEREEVLDSGYSHHLGDATMALRLMVDKALSNC